MSSSTRDGRHLSRKSRSGIYLAAAALAATTLSITPAASQVVRDNLWMPDGPVNAVVTAGQTVYFGGSFTHVGPPTGCFTVVDRSSAAVLPPSASVAGAVNGSQPRITAIASDGNGGWYIGGSFSMVQGQPRSNLAHVDSNGDLMQWNPGTDSYVFAVAYNAATNTVYVGGFFSSVGGQSRSHLAAVDGTTGTVTPWDPHPLNTGLPGNTNVFALAVHGNLVYVGGNFTTIGGQPRTYLAAVDTTGAPTGWTPNPDLDVFCIAVRSLPVFPFTATVYVGGAFANIGGQARSNIAALDGSTGAATSWNPSANYSVDAIALGGGVGITPLTIYAGGEFTAVGGQTRHYLAALDPNGAATSWNPSPNNQVYALSGASPLYVGGGFSTIGGQNRQYLAAVDGTGAATAWDPSAGSAVHALLAGATTVAVGGDFASMGGVARNSLAAIDAVSGQPIAWDPNANGVVKALALGGGLIYAGGAFTSVGGLARNHVAQIGTDGSVGSWNPNASDEVDALVVRPLNLLRNTIYMGGAFTSMAGQTRNHLASMSDAPLAELDTWDPNPNGVVNALAVGGSTIYAGGEFTTVGACNYCSDLVALDLGGAVLHSGFGDGAVNALALSDTLLCVGGNFNNMGGRPREDLAVLDARNLITTTWDPFTNDQVLGLAVGGTTLYISGYFSDIGLTPRNGLGALDLTNGLVSGWNADENAGFGDAIAVGGGTVYVGGAYGGGAAEHVNLVGLSSAVTAVAPIAADASANPLRLSENPFRERVRLLFRVPERTQGEVAVHDIEGRLVRRLEQGELLAGEHDVPWDGRDSYGRRVGAGVYFVRVSAGKLDLRAKVLRLD